jgi:hypothetical protein
MPRIQNKPTRIIVKLLLYFFGVVILLFTCVSIYVESNKKQILEKLRKGVSENLRSEIRYRDADITIWRNFPFIGVRFYDISVEDSVYHMPFFKMKEVAGKVSVFQYFKKTIELQDLYMADGTMHVFTDTSGYTNKYLVQFKKNPEVKEKKKVLLNHASLRNVRLILENRQRNKLFDFSFEKLDADISLLGKRWTIDLQNKAVINSMAFNLDKGSYLKGQSIEMNADLVFDTEQHTLSFNEEKFIVNGQPYFMKGRFMVKAPGYFSLAIRTKNAPYKNIQQVLSQNIGVKLSKFNIEKPIDAEARLEGPLAFKTVPKILASWTVKNNVLTTEVAKFTNCSFTGTFTNEKVNLRGFTDQNSEITLDNFSGNWEGIALNGKNITVTNLIEPYLRFSLASSTDFKTLNNKLGLKTIELLEGRAALNLSYAGPLEKDISILDRLNGQLNFNNGTIRYIPRGFTFNNCSGNVFFSDNSVRVDELKCDLGKDHFVVNVSGTNMSGLSSTDASKASVNCSVYSPSLDIGMLKGLFARKKTAAHIQGKSQKLIHTAARVDDIMDNGSLSVSLNAGTVHYRNFTGKDLRGNVVFANDDMFINNVSLIHANGRLDVNGNIKQTTNSNSATAKVSLQNVDVKKLFYSFDNFGQDGIASENIQGMLNALTNIGLAFDANGNVIPGTIKGTVDFSLRNGALVNYEPIMDIKKSVFKKADMSNVTFAELKDKLEINGFHVKINKMEIQSSAIGMFVDGLYDIKKADTKINIQVPLKGLKKRDSTYIPENIGVDAKKGLSIYLEGKVDQKTGKVKIGLNTTRTLRKIL